MTRLALLLALLLLAPTRPAAAMEHEEIVARLATGQCVPSYETRACRKQRRLRASGARPSSAVHLTK
jgi:predicted lipoprotein